MSTNVNYTYIGGSSNVNVDKTDRKNDFTGFIIQNYFRGLRYEKDITTFS